MRFVGSVSAFNCGECCLKVLPAVDKDVILIALTLGLRFLWVVGYSNDI